MECEYCHKTFSSRYNLRIHKERKHPIVDEGEELAVGQNFSDRESNSPSADSYEEDAEEVEEEEDGDDEDEAQEDQDDASQERHAGPDDERYDNPGWVRLTRIALRNMDEVPNDFKRLLVGEYFDMFRLQLQKEYKTFLEIKADITKCELHQDLDHMTDQLMNKFDIEDENDAFGKAWDMQSNQFRELLRRNKHLYDKLMDETTGEAVEEGDGEENNFQFEYA